VSKRIDAAAKAREKERAGAAATQAKLTTARQIQIKKLTEATAALERFKGGLEGIITSDTTIPEASSSAQLADGLVQNLRRQFDDFGRFLPQNQVQQIRDRANVDQGGQLTRAERDRIRQLESRFGGGAGLRATNEAGGRRVARRLFRDDQTGRGIVRDFRQTADTRSAQEATRLRGEGARGRRNIDVDAVKRFFEGRGLTGTAESIDTKGEAAKALDQFVGLSERLAKEQEKISTETKNKIVEVLGRELSQGTRDAIAKREGEFTQAEKDKARRDAAATKKFVSDVATAFERAVNGVFGGKNSVSGSLVGEISKAIEAAPPIKVEQTPPIKVEFTPQEIKLEAVVRQPDAFTDQQLIEIIRAAMGGVTDDELIQRLSVQMGSIVRELQRKGILTTGAHNIRNEVPLNPLNKRRTPSGFRRDPGV